MLSFETLLLPGLRRARAARLGFAAPLLISAVGLPFTAAAAGPASVVRDIYPGADTSPSSYPRRSVVIGTTMYFTASDPYRGEELWKTDGTEGGTVPVRDICPGPGTSLPESLTGAGTAVGTVLVKNIRPYSSSSVPETLTAVNGTLYFVAEDGAAARELWKSDGTAEGTVLVRDVRPGAGGSSAKNLRGVHGVLLFSADDGVRGQELWKSDGTPAGTRRIQEISPGPAGSEPALFTAVGTNVFFCATEDDTRGNGAGRELWSMPQEAMHAGPTVNRLAAEWSLME